MKGMGISRDFAKCITQQGQLRRELSLEKTITKLSLICDRIQ
jgi:hypothetical protein